MLNRFEQKVKAEIKQLDETLASLLREPGLEIFALNGGMLDRVVSLSASDLFL